MPSFRYTVVNPSNQQLQGVIQSPDEASARQELNDLEFSIVALEEISEGEASAVEGKKTSTDDDQTTFEFAGLDKNQKRVRGTIQATDSYQAYKRLVEEYHFEVEYVIEDNLSEEEKVEARKKGAYQFQKQLDAEESTNKKNKADDSQDLQEFQKKQAVLQKQITFVLEKVSAMITKYEEELNPVTKEKIRKQVDKILRIKNSTNLEYVRKTTEELLTFIQQEELFIHEENYKQDRTSMAIEAKSMMMQLHSGKSKKSLNIRDAIRQWRTENIINQDHVSIINKVLDFFARTFLGISKENEQVIAIKNEISSVNEQLIHYIKLYFQSPNPDFKAQTRKGIQNLWNTRKKLKKTLRMEKKKEALRRKQVAKELPSEKFFSEVLYFLGWLLTFYLIYYFIALYIGTKDIGISAEPYFTNMYRSSFLKYFIATIFVLYGGLSIKVHFFQRNEVATLVITPTVIMAIVLLYLNF